MPITKGYRQLVDIRDIRALAAGTVVGRCHAPRGPAGTLEARPAKKMGKS